MKTPLIIPVTLNNNSHDERAKANIDLSESVNKEHMVTYKHSFNSFVNPTDVEQEGFGIEA